MTLFYLTVFLGSIWILFWLSRGAFFVPMPRAGVERVIGLLALQKGEKAVDVGSGDGRLLLALAEAGAEALGFEHNILLVWRSRRNIRQAGLSDTASVRWSNFWNEDFSAFDAVTIYGIPYIMGRLEKSSALSCAPARESRHTLSHFRTGRQFNLTMGCTCTDSRNFRALLYLKV